LYFKKRDSGDFPFPVVLLTTILLPYSRRLLFLLNLAPTVIQTTRARIVLPVPIVEFLDIPWRSATGFMDFHQASNSPRAIMLQL
jgi:hypothetical protein